MNKDLLIDAIGGIDDAVLLEVNAVRARKPRKAAARRWISLAACFILVLSAALTAEATDGTVSNLLAPVFGGAKTEIVDQIGVPIGASTSVNGYTLTADAIIGDRYSAIIAYTLTREDGQPIPENIGFQHREIWASGYRTRIEIDENDPSTAHFHERNYRNVPLFGRIFTNSFTNLVIDNGDEDETLVAEGTWALTFAFRYPDATEKLPVKAFDVTDAGGRTYTVKEILLSPVGIHLGLVFHDPDYTDGIFKDFKISLVMADGTELPLPDGGGGGSWTEGDRKADISYYADFDIPIAREEIQSIVICGTAYELGADE